MRDKIRKRSRKADINKQTDSLVRKLSLIRIIFGSARGVIVIVVGNGHGDTSSIPETTIFWQYSPGTIETQRLYPLRHGPRRAIKGGKSPEEGQRRNLAET